MELDWKGSLKQYCPVRADLGEMEMECTWSNAIQMQYKDNNQELQSSASCMLHTRPHLILPPSSPLSPSLPLRLTLSAGISSWLPCQTFQNSSKTRMTCMGSSGALRQNTSLWNTSSNCTLQRRDGVGSGVTMNSHKCKLWCYVGKT